MKRPNRGGKSVWRAAVLLALLSAVMGFAALSARRGEGRRFAARLGNGINVGNALDVQGVRAYEPEAEELLYETQWGNPPIERALFAAISEAGLKSVRLPVSWCDHMDAEGRVSEVWMERVAQVVDMALDEGLYVILDSHHEQWLSLEPERGEELCRRLESLWRQIAERFAAYPQTLLFEGMNEPRLKGSEVEWSAPPREQLELVNALNQAFVRAVRGSGGENASRWLLIAPYCNLMDETVLKALAIPDRRCMVAVHCYEPYSFCQEGNGTGLWQEEWREAFAQRMEGVNRALLRRGVPVLISEAGCRDKNNLNERIQWVSALAKAAQAYGVGCFLWDNGSSYRLLDRENNAIAEQALIQALGG